MCVTFKFCVVGALACQLSWASIAVMSFFCFSDVYVLSFLCLGVQYCVPAVSICDNNNFILSTIGNYKLV